MNVWVPAVAIAGGFTVVGLGLMITSKHLPSRPDTGNHGQGHSPNAACPGQYKAPVQVDGKTFPLTCFGKISYFEEDMAIAATFTEKTFVFQALPAGGMTVDVADVPTMSDFHAVTCFKLQDKRAIQCLYVAKNGTVMQRGVILDEVAV